MNQKKIRRLMRKYNLSCPVRRQNPYRQMIRAMKTNSISDNLVNREFKEHGPRTILLTDITYTRLNNEFIYLSVILDAFTKEVLSYVLSESLEIDFVLQTVNLLIQKHGSLLNTSTIIHSDYAEEKTMPKNLITSCILIIRIQFFGIVFRVSQARRLLSLYQRSSTAFRHRQLWEQTC